MLLQKLGGIALTIAGLGVTFLANGIFKFASQSDSTNIMQFDRWPSWMFPAWIWAIRIIGILAAFVGILLVFRNR